MGTNNFVLSAGVVVTFVIGLFNLFQTSRTTFINTVTAERVKWIGSVRDNVSKFVGLNHHWFVLKRDISEQQKDEFTREIRLLRYYIKLQLNPKAALDKEIMTLVDCIADNGSNYDGGQMQKKLNDLVSQSQQLLKAEWDKVRWEAWPFRH